jgi:hypothetical protein
VGIVRALSRVQLVEQFIDVKSIRNLMFGGRRMVNHRD